MKHLVVYSHPNPKSFNHAILEKFTATLEKQGHEVRVRDLYALQFDPVLKPQDFIKIKEGSASQDVLLEQDHIRRADIITFIYPVWWTGLPAMIKGYIDRVFSFGFAYTVTEEGIKGLLSDKKVFIINTTGTPEEIYAQSGMFSSLKQTSDEGIFEFCAMEVIGHHFFCAVPSITDEAGKAMLTKVKELAAGPA